MEEMNYNTHDELENQAANLTFEDLDHQDDETTSNEKEFKSFQTLDCWKSATELRRFISELTKQLPSEENNGLIYQLRRSSRGATDAIAEGYGRFHYQENIQFCRQARGYIYQLLNQLIIAKDEGFISEEDFNKAQELIEKSLAILNGYINYLIKAKKQRDRNKRYSHA
jgi:four helix bundle protein